MTFFIFILTKINSKMCFYYLRRPENDLNCFETLTLYIAVMLNFGWVTIATILSITTTLIKFEVDLPGDDVIWSVLILMIAYGLFYLSSILYHNFIYEMVFVAFNFTLFLKYMFLIVENGNIYFISIYFFKLFR